MTNFVPRNSGDFQRKEIERLRTENADLGAQVHQHRAFVTALNSLYEMTDRIKSDSELFPFLKDTLRNAMRLLNAPDGSLALYDDEAKELVFVIVIGELSDQLTDHRMPASEGIAGWVVRNGKPALVRNTQTDPRFYNKVDDTFTFQTQSIAAAPLIGNRKVYGLVEVLNQPGDAPFSDNDLALLKLFCRVAGEALADIDRREQEMG